MQIRILLQTSADPDPEPCSLSRLLEKDKASLEEVQKCLEKGEMLDIYLPEVQYRPTHAVCPRSIVHSYLVRILKEVGNTSLGHTLFYLYTGFIRIMPRISSSIQIQIFASLCCCWFTGNDQLNRFFAKDFV